MANQRQTQRNAHKFLLWRTATRFRWVHNREPSLNEVHQLTGLWYPEIHACNESLATPIVFSTGNDKSLLGLDAPSMPVDKWIKRLDRKAR